SFNVSEYSHGDIVWDNVNKRVSTGQPGLYEISFGAQWALGQELTLQIRNSANSVIAADHGKGGAQVSRRVRTSAVSEIFDAWVINVSGSTVTIFGRDTG